jgi:hypothetical protein
MNLQDVIKAVEARRALLPYKCKGDPNYTRAVVLGEVLAILRALEQGKSAP